MQPLQTEVLIPITVFGDDDEEPNETVNLTATSTVAAGTLTVAGQSVPAHCLVTGKMNQRVSAVDGQTYASAPLPVQLRLRLYKPADAATWAMVQKSYRNLLRWEQLATSRMRTATFADPADADRLYAQPRWVPPGIRGDAP